MLKEMPLFASQSRYALLAQSLLERISNGLYPRGSMLPTEAELCKQFGVSRTTVREAMRALIEKGLVARKPGVGTWVRSTYADPRFVHSLDSIADIFQYGWRSAKPVMLSRRNIEATAQETELLSCEPGQQWTRFEYMRSLASKGTPMVHTVGYISPLFPAVVDQIPSSVEPTYSHIERLYGEDVAALEQRISAVSIDAREARLLKVKAGSPGLYVVRHFFGSRDRLLLVTQSTYPSARFSYVMHHRYEKQARKGDR